MNKITIAELRPGDRITFGDHTGWYRVRSVEPSLVKMWWRRSRVVNSSTPVWRADARD